MSTAQHNDIAAAWSALEPIFLVRDVASSLTFYRERLGFTVEAHWEAKAADGEGTPGAILSARDLWQLGGAGLRIRLQQLEEDQALPAPGSIVLIAVADGIEALATDYRARGVRLTAELTTLSDGTRTFSVCDPNGHLLHFAEIGSATGDQVEGEPPSGTVAPRGNGNDVTDAGTNKRYLRGDGPVPQLGEFGVAGLLCRARGRDRP